MARSWVVRVACLLAAMTLFGLSAVHATPEGGTAVGIWPIVPSAWMLPLLPYISSLSCPAESGMSIILEA